MAGRNNNKLTAVQSSVDVKTHYDLALGYTVGYIDIAQCLSMINRKLFSQQYSYSISSIEARFIEPTVGIIDPWDSISVEVATVGDTWTVQNGWVKGKALHEEMQDLVLDDNPSISGKWAEFKVYYDNHHMQANMIGLNNNLLPYGSGDIPALEGEWEYSTFVLPQHEVDAAGIPLPAIEVQGTLIGDDQQLPFGPNSRSLAKAYALSRATVAPATPNVQPGVATSFFNLLTDSGSQEPELAAVIIDENDFPPYDIDVYPGVGANIAQGFVQGSKIMNIHMPNMVIPGFDAQCGLLRVKIESTFGGNLTAGCPSVHLRLKLKRGSYKGIAAQPMGQ